MQRRRFPSVLLAVTVALALAGATAVSASAVYVKTHVRFHVDAYGDWGGCRLGADSQANFTLCNGWGQPASQPFTDRHVDFGWSYPPLWSCQPNEYTRATGLDKQVILQDHQGPDSRLCGYTKRDFSSAALIIVESYEAYVGGHWVKPWSGHDMSKIGHEGGPLYLNLIHHRYGSRNEYTMSIHGYLEYWRD